MVEVAISGTGSFLPQPVITNDELCASFNRYVASHNDRHAAAIASGERAALSPSSPAFIVKASGIRQRHVWERDGLLDPERMCPNIPDRADAALSVQCEMAVAAAQRALAAADLRGEQIDLLILAASSLQRMYPAIAMEVQAALGASGHAFDLSVGCSSATYPIQLAGDSIRAGHATRALLVNPELTTPHMNWRDRDSHFIFGDAATAIVLERADLVSASESWLILGSKLWSRFSSNIRNNGGYLNRCDPTRQFAADKLFYQRGRRVFKDVVSTVPGFIAEHLGERAFAVDEIRRFWLHQANLTMDELIAKRLLGRPATRDDVPIVLDRYANTASCGSILAFHEHRGDLAAGDLGVICSFGAGYSIGSVIVRKR